MVPAVEFNFSKPVVTVIDETLLVEIFPDASMSIAEFAVQDPVAASVVAPVMYKPPPAFSAAVFEKAPLPVNVMFPDPLVVTAAF
jgi:hypothetical protein